ncbi:helix-turn-helix transcriptional regulator [Jidongwangia harbinensis]|uniref:helix-turn-helix transcriptional regulator n=1 Tax=Jidongwangia harbinensis TaxID=2878561 RepID=UPI001CDA0CD2|nr:helix-turn-helix transcriptional regulator [Jidongwangia harbinensis]MCA2214159.1 helix-turn-helix transcriptional regulator [Jidongwangia harbinensis]
MTTAPLTRRGDLADFLRRRREALSPAAAGLPFGTRRRTPGLRRDEVAMLAHMSTVYYERLEQGRGPRPSAPMLAGLAGALRLTAGEREYLYRLAGQAAPAPPGDLERPDPGLLAVLRACGPATPAFISDDLGTVLAQNDLNVALFGRFTGLAGREDNLIWRWFTCPRWRYVLEPSSQHPDTGHAYVADLRAVVAQRDHDPAATELVAALRTASAEFSAMWDEHRVGALHCAGKVVEDDRVGRLDLECTVVTTPQSRQRLLILRPAPETGTGRRLAALIDQVRA